MNDRFYPTKEFLDVLLSGNTNCIETKTRSKKSYLKVDGIKVSSKYLTFMYKGVSTMSMDIPNMSFDAGDTVTINLSDTFTYPIKII